jgi:2-polyprenyl-3-methyl-5-hydroxy-6-metoxy-1,4-benzoquinol methylase
MPDYEVKTMRIDIAHGSPLTVRSLLDRQQYFDPHGVAEAAGISPATWPLFGLLWPSSQKLADLMQVIELNDRRVLEIGCGLALASLVVHRRSGNITASDCHPLAETFLVANAKLNVLPTLAYRTGNWGRKNPQLGEFDLIIGGDVLYERDHPAQLADFIALHAAANAEVIIIDPNRGNTAAFNRAMLAHGFLCKETPIDAPLADGAEYRGKMLRYLRTQQMTAPQVLKT